MENQIKVNSYDNYNAPVDNKNIAYLEIPNVGIYKCFQMTPGIWVTPETTPHKPVKVDIPDVTTTSHYKGKKLDSETIKSYNQYLKDIFLYFQRLKLFSVYRPFFQIIRQASPYKYYKEFVLDKKEKALFKNQIASVLIVNQKTKKRIGVVNLSMLIMQDKYCDPSTRAHIRESKNILKEQAYGSISRIYFNPRTIQKIHNQDNTYFFKDPLLVLFHELVHGFHFIYGYGDAEVEVNDMIYNVDEVITHGGKKDLDLLQDSIKSYNRQYIHYVQGIVDNLNSSHKSQFFKDFYARKFFLEKTQTKYNLTENSKKRLIILLQNTFTETILAKSSSNLKANSYYDQIGVEYYNFDPFNKIFYNIKTGIEDRAFAKYIKDNKIKPIHVIQ